MGKTTKIEWTEHTFNPWWGCTKVSKGCAHCYADTFSHRLGKDIWGPGKSRLFFGDKKWTEPLKWNREAEAEGRRHRVFCASMADVFEAMDTVQNQSAFDGIQAARVRLFELIRTTPWLDWQLLTKRPDNIIRALKDAHETEDCSDELMDWLGDWIYRGEPPRNVWLGYSVACQEDADRGIPELLKVPAAIRFLSVEPLIGPVNLRTVQHDGMYEIDALNGKVGVYRPLRHECKHVDWVIVGGESGPGARPMHPDWARSLRDQCAEAGVPFFFKQFGEWSPIYQEGATPCFVNLDGSWELRPFPGKVLCCDGASVMHRVGKHNAGNLLDGRVYQQFPEVSA